MDPRSLLEAAAEHIDGLLNVPRQLWLLGAGISFDAGIPLTYALTERPRLLVCRSRSDGFRIRQFDNSVK